MSSTISERSGDTATHTPTKVIRCKAPSRVLFDPEHHRRWHVMGVVYEGEPCRYLIPLGLGEGEADEDKGLRVPILAGCSGDGCVVQKRDGTETVKVVTRKQADDGTIEEIEEEYERIVWRNLAENVHHPVMGRVVVVIEPSIAWEIVEKDGAPVIMLQWEDELGDDRHADETTRVETRARLLRIMCDELDALQQDLKHEEDPVIRKDLERDIEAQIEAVTEMQARSGLDNR